MSMKVSDLKKPVLPERPTLQEILQRDDPVLVKQMHDVYRRYFASIEQHLRDIGDRGTFEYYKDAMLRIEKRLRALGGANWHDDQIAKSGIEDIQSILNHEMFWITADGRYGWVPPYGHHDDVAYQAFGNNDEDDRIDYSDVAMKHGWVRALYSPRGELNLEFIRKKISPKAKQVVLQLIEYLSEHALSYVFEIHVGRKSINQTFPDARSAAVLVRQN